ncbi:MAG: OmpA family protein [Pseudomonadota bacterium]
MLRLAVFLPVAFAVGMALRWSGGHLAALVEERTAAHATAVADVLEADWVSFKIDGMHVALGGEAAESDVRILTAALSRMLPGGRFTDDTTRPSIPPERRATTRVDLFQGSDGITVTGQLPDAGTRAELLAVLRRAMPEAQIHDLTGLGTGADGLDGAEFAVAAAALGALSQAAIRLEPGRVEVSAGVPSEAERTEAEMLLRTTAGPGIEIELQLRVPRRLIVPFKIAIAKREGQYRLETCAVRDAVEAETLAAALALVDLREDRARCEIGLGGPDLEWAAAATAGLRALTALPDGRFELFGERAHLSSTGAERPAFERAMGMLGGSLPTGFMLEGELDEARDLLSGAGRLWLRIERQGEVMTLAGRVSGASAQHALVDLAGAQRGADLVDHARLASASPAVLAAQEDDPMRFQHAALAAVETMAAAGLGGTVTVTAAAVEADIVSLTSRAGASALRALSTGLPTGLILESRLTVDVPGAVAALPFSRERCIAALNEAVAERPITFDPGSTRLDAASERRIDDLAQLMARCDGARVEIGGHTDNQGRASMNERLSRARAEAVVAALQARGIGPRLAILTARGYGETEPVAPNDSEVGRALNRRIAFRAGADPERAGRR